MLPKTCLWLALLSTTAALAAQNFLLGVDYSERIPTGSLPNVYMLAAGTDSQGALYLLVSGTYLMKLTPAGDRVVYQTSLAFQAYAMAVDPAGGVYIGGSNFAEKLGTDGATVVYRTVIGENVGLNSIAVDASGRAYVTGVAYAGDLQTTPGAFQQTASGPYRPHAFVVRLTPGGAIDYATYLGGSGQEQEPFNIAVDSSGSAFVIGMTYSADFPVTPGAYLTDGIAGNPGLGLSFLTRLSPDGSKLIYSTFTDAVGNRAQNVAVDPAGNAVVALVNVTGPSNFIVMRFNPEGTALTFSKFLPASFLTGLAADGAGDTYVTAFSGSANYPANNSLAPCTAGGSAALSIFDASGGVLQSTYIAGAASGDSASLGLTVSAASTVYVVGSPDATYTPTEQLAGSSNGLLFLTRLSQNGNARPVQLACVGNSADFDDSAISAGEIVTLFGNGLGPAAGTQPQVDIRSEFPKQLANVQVTFNGAPGPLLYVQAGRINAIAPWSLQTGSAVEVCVAYSGARTNCLPLTVADAHPGVFTVDGYYAAALNQDGKLNMVSNPAKVGSIVSVFGTGLGPISPPQPDGAIVGLPLPVDSLAAWMGAWMYGIFGGLPGPVIEPVTVLYAGPAPFEVAGVSQINFIVADTGLPLVLQSGLAASGTFQVHIAP